MTKLRNISLLLKTKNIWPTISQLSQYSVTVLKSFIIIIIIIVRDFVRYYMT